MSPARCGAGHLDRDIGAWTMDHGLTTPSWLTHPLQQVAAPEASQHVPIFPGFCGSRPCPTGPNAPRSSRVSGFGPLRCLPRACLGSSRVRNPRCSSPESAIHTNQLFTDLVVSAVAFSLCWQSRLMSLVVTLFSSAIACRLQACSNPLSCSYISSRYSYDFLSVKHIREQSAWHLFPLLPSYPDLGSRARNRDNLAE